MPCRKTAKDIYYYIRFPGDIIDYKIISTQENRGYL
jgi:hypothetical protein